MERNTLEAQRRTATGTKHARLLRQEQRVPGIIYGPKQDPVPFCVDRHDLEVELLHGQRVLSLNLEGQTHAYLIREVQYDHLGSEFLHLDLSPINLDEKVTLKVAVELRGTPKGATEGGVLDQNLNEIEIECLASDIPTAIKASVASLDVNESLTVGDLKLPARSVSSRVHFRRSLDAGTGPAHDISWPAVLHRKGYQRCSGFRSSKVPRLF